MIPKKLPPIPKAMISTDCVIMLHEPELSEDGENLEGVTFTGKCAFSEKRVRIYDAEKHIIQLNGQAVVPGDIASSLSTACIGSMTVNGVDYTVFKVKRPRNPDGTVHHTSLELM